MNNSASDDDALINGPSTSQPPISVLFGGRSNEAFRSEYHQLLAANDELLRAVGDVREIETTIAEGNRQLRDSAQRIARLEKRAHAAEMARDSARAEIIRLQEELERAQVAGPGLEAAIGRAAWAEKLAARQIARAEALQSGIAEVSSAFRGLENALDAALDARAAALKDVENARTETAAWVAECELLLAQVEAYAIEAERGTAERESLLSTLEERNAELLSWLDTAEQLNQQVGTLQSAVDALESERADRDREIQRLREEAGHWHGRCEALEGHLATSREETRHWHGRCEALEQHLKEARDEARHWHGRNEALEVHLENARTEGARRANELQAQLDAEKSRAEGLERDLTDLVDRFTKVTQTEIERTRAEIAHLSSAINNVQSGRVWRIKYWLRRLAGRR